MIRKGELRPLRTAPANRDPAFIADGDRLDISRGLVGHLAFGPGVHQRLGAPLARLEMSVPRAAAPLPLGRPRCPAAQASARSTSSTG